MLMETGQQPPGNAAHESHVALFRTPGLFWDVLLHDCKAARQTIHIDHYILRNDQIGKRLTEILIERAQSGVKIDMLLDRVGSREAYGTPMIRSLRDAGANIRFYNNLFLFHLFTPSKWFPRNHVKTILIDQAIMYVGSACLADDMAQWRDVHLKIAGPAVPHMLQQKSQDLRYAVSKPHLKRNPIYQELLGRINNAQTSIQLVTPYFLPPIRLRRALKRAVKRGVDVKIMLGRQTDVPFANCVSVSFFPSLLMKGIKILAYTPRVFHAKYMIIDDSWATIGSCNLDYLSLFRNREANLMITDTDLINRLKVQFSEDEQECEKIDMVFYHNLPIWYKFLAYAGRSVKHFL
ncbi:MAG TPA: phospholipase D-like domain-containing protein [Alphaproteobacteria bacterium]